MDDNSGKSDAPETSVPIAALSPELEPIVPVRRQPRWITRIPNWLTLVRIILIPVFVVLLIDPTPGSRRGATIIFILAAITDYLDGVFARRLGAVSDLGKLLDPLADKILVAAALIMLVGMRDDYYGDPYVPAWLVVVILSREFWVTGLRGVAAVRGQVVQAGGSGKLKSVLQMVGIVLLLLSDPTVSFGGRMLSSHFIGMNLLVLSVLFSVIGAYQYSVAVLLGDTSPATFKNVAARAWSLLFDTSPKKG